jgi:PIN domain nuclease of toxin-antitoxin system
LILLDTHVVVWLASGEVQIPPRAQAAIDQARQGQRGLAVSDFTLYEVSMLFRKHKISLSGNLESFLSEVEKHFTVLPITGPICVRAASLPANYPKDPGDRIIGATALEEGLTLITADSQIRNSQAIQVVW